jgi:K+-transporting ATPase KdpF subunit
MRQNVLASFIPMVAAPVHSGATVTNGSVGYLIGGAIAILLLGYLVYTLLHPEKF